MRARTKQRNGASVSRRNAEQSSIDDMTASLYLFTCITAAVGAGLVAGTFFAFSAFVMAALGRLSPANGIAAMQQINVVVINPVFMTAFIGTALLSVVVGVWSGVQWRPGSAWAIAGAALYVVGTFGVTIAFNVPRNNALARVDAASAEGAAVWADYLRTWTAWNTVRTVAATASLV
jgi:uncharacterized membrane protein